MIHPASLVPQSNHPRKLLNLVGATLNPKIIEYLVSRVAVTVDYALQRPAQFKRQSATLTKFTAFVETVLTRAEVTTATVLTTLVYLERAQPHLHIALEEWALERVFLGALIVAAKYTNDSTLKNVHWALCTGVFGKRDVGRIEREFLEVLDFELGIKDDDLLRHYEPVMYAVAFYSSPTAMKSAPSAATPAPTTIRRGRQPTRKSQAQPMVPPPVMPDPDLMETEEEEDEFEDDDSSDSDVSSPQTPQSPPPAPLALKKTTKSSLGSIFKFKSLPLSQHSLPATAMEIC